MALVKLSFSLPTEELNNLTEMAKMKGITVTEMLRHSIANFMFFDDEVRQGSTIVLSRQSPWGTTHRDVVWK